MREPEYMRTYHAATSKGAPLPSLDPMTRLNQATRLLGVLCLAVLAGPACPEPTEEEIEHLMFDLEEAAPETRDEMVRKLQRLMSPAAAPALLTVLANINEEDLPATRRLAERYDCRLADGRAVANCADMLASENPQVRRYAVRVLPFAKTPEALKLIRKATEDPELAVRSTAIEALGYTAQPGLLPDLEQLCRSTDSHVAGAAQVALRTLKWQTGQRPREDFGKRVYPKRTIVQVGPNAFWKQWSGRDRLHVRLGVRTFDPGDLGEQFSKALAGTRLMILARMDEATQARVVQAEGDRQAITQFLKSGGTLVIDGGVTSREARKYLESIGVTTPQGAKLVEYAAVPSDEEVHSLIAWPFRISPLVSGLDGAVCWERWDPSQSTPYRNQSDSKMAAMIVQENVLGAGRVVFNGIAGMYDTGQRHCDMIENLLATAFDSPDRTLYYFFRLLHDFRTPAWGFAEPWAGPKLKVLFIGDSYLKRDIVELCQRTDLLDYTYATLVERREGPYGRNSNTLEGASVVDLQQKIAGNYDVYVLARRGRAITRKHWELLPEDIRRIIMRRVLRGAGLLILGSGSGTGKEEKPDEEIAELRNLPVLEDDFAFTVGTQPYETGSHRRGRESQEAIKLRQAGKGRIALINDFRRPGEAFTSPALFERFMRFRPEDYVYSLFLRSLLWAGGQEPLVKVDSIGPQSTPVPAFQSPAIVLRLSSTKGEALELNIEADTIDLTNQVTGRASHAASLAADGVHEVHISLPPLPSGVHIARVCVRLPDGKIANWASTALTVDSGIKLTEAKWSQSVYRAGDTLKAEVKVRGEVPGPGAKLQARLIDTRGRLMGEAALEVGPRQTSVSVSMPVPEPVTILADLHLRLIHERGPLAEEQFPVSFTWPRKDLQDFKWFVWRNAGNGVERWATADLGVDYAHTEVEKAENSLRYNGAVYRLSFDRLAGPPGGGGGTSRRPCYQNTNYHFRAMEQVREVAPRLLRVGVRDIMLEDEASIGGAFCFCPTCLFHFREWARRTYGELKALNAEWGTGFESWEEVRGASLDEIKSPARPGPWLDHRRYMDSVFSARIRRYREAIQVHIPDATVGMSGTQRQSPSSNYDWWQLCHAGNLWLAYGGAQTKLRRSFRTPDTVMAMWGGGYNRADNGEASTRRRLWWLLFNRYDGYAYYWGGSDAFIMLEPDLTPVNIAAWTADAVGRLKQGLGEMLLRSRLDNSGIGMHYSVTSQYSSYPSAKLQKGRPAFMDNLLSLGMPFEDLRRQFTYVAYQEIEMGELMARRFKLLLLPNSQAISAREAENIRKFVEAGGTVLADFAVAERNEHGTWQEKGLLKEVFGLRVRKPAAAFRNAQLELTKPLGALQPGPLGEFQAPFENGLVATTATPHGLLRAQGKTTPGLLVNRHGNGRAIYLNFSFDGYGALRVAGFGGELTDVQRLRLEHGARIRQLTSALMGLAGIERGFEWNRSDSRTDFSEVYVYRNGPLSYVGVLPGTRQEDPVDWERRDDYRLRLPAKAFVYDCREGKLLGHDEIVHARPTTGIPTLYAVMPYQVKSIEVGAGEAAVGKPLTVTLEVATSGPEPAEHILHVNIEDASGKLRPEYRQNVVASEGKGEMTVPLALNDPVGEWMVTAKDAATGVVGECRFVVEE